MKPKAFTFTLLKSLNPKYYSELADRPMPWKYFAILIFISFIFMAIIAAPKIYFIKNDFDQQILDISEFSLNTEFSTLKPIAIPKNNPSITIDTTGEEKYDEEEFLITDSKIYYKYLGKEKAIETNGFDITQDRQESKNIIVHLIILLIPSIFFYYYLAYFLKYILIITLTTVIFYAFSKMTKNILNFKQFIALGLYTSTPMVLLEILTIPYFIKNYLVSFSPITGIYFSVIAITLFLTLFVTAIRIAGNPDLE